MSLATTTWQRIGRSADLSPGACVPVRVGVAEYALCRTTSGSLHAIDGTCPHMAARLGEGMPAPGATLTCPWHAWTFDLSSGERTDQEGTAVQTHPVREVDGWIELELPTPDPAAGWDPDLTEGPPT